MITEAYLESKIIEECKKAGATAEEAAKVVKEVGVKVEKVAVVDSEKLSDMLVESLGKVNKAARNIVTGILNWDNDLQKTARSHRKSHV